MELIRDIYHPDVALIPVGDRFTMGPVEAAHALRLLRPSIVVPMHWGTFPVIEPTPERFIEKAKEVISSDGLETEVRALNPGDTLEL